jgi:predicted secreted Zn-dependent protease
MLLALTTFSAEGQETVAVTRTTVYYDVAGSTIEELVESMADKSPAGIGGFDAKTDFSFVWDADRLLERHADGTRVCRLHNASVVIDITVHLPRFSAVADASREIQRAWRSYISALERHELNHVEDFVEIGSLIPAALEAITSTNCTVAWHTANAKGKEFTALAQQRALDYDLQTNHGAKEGAILPGF